MRPERLFALVPLLLLLLGGCASRSRVILPKGIKAVEVGDEMPPASLRRFKGFSVRDSLASSGQYEWRVLCLAARGGAIYVEDHFFLPGSVNRIRIDSPEYSTRNGLRVGGTVADLRAAASPWTVAPLREYRLFDFYTRLMPNLHFLVDDPSHGMEDEEWEKYPPEGFAGDAKIVAIVVY